MAGFSKVQMSCFGPDYPGGMRTAELLIMSTKELERAELLCRIRERRITQEQAAVMLGVSARQLRRWYQAYKAGGPAAQASKKRGRPSNNQLLEALKLEALRLVRERSTGCGPTLAHGKLTEAHGVRVSVETLRKWMREAGLWSTRAERRKPWRRLSPAASLSTVVRA
jgi:transposase